jgi:transposase
MGEGRGAYRIVVGRPEGRRPLGKPRLDGRLIIKWIFKSGMGGMDWIDMAQDRDRWWALVSAVMNLRVP